MHLPEPLDFVPLGQLQFPIAKLDPAEHTLQEYLPFVHS